MSAAVRLGVCGPMEGQALQARLAAGTLEPLLLLPAAVPSPPPPDDDAPSGAQAALDAEGWPVRIANGARAAPPAEFGVRHTAPLAELLQATHDRLYSRLFNS